MEIKIPSVIILAGKPQSGKSYLIKYFMYEHRKVFDYGIVLTKTKFNDGYNYIPSNYIHPDYDDTKIKSLMKIQADLHHKGVKKNAFIILDDCLTSETNSQTFTDLITQHRHYNITVIISTQYIYKINPTIRECTNYAIIFRPSTDRSIKALFESYGSHFNKLDDFKKYVIENTGEYQFVFVDVNSQSDEIGKIYRVLKAPSKIPYFKLIVKNKLSK
jgi:hypothetical protein